MSDAQLRELERRARSSGAPEDAAGWRVAQVRAGALTDARLSLLAYLGDSGALRALDQPTPPDDPPVEQAILWLRGLSLWGERVLYRGILTWLQAAATDGPATLQSALARAFNDPVAADALALRTAHGDDGRLRLVAAQSSWLTLAVCKPESERRRPALLGVLDRLLWDVDHGQLPPPPPLSAQRVALADTIPETPGVSGDPGQPDLRGRALFEATPPERAAARPHFQEHGPGTYAFAGAQEYVRSCGYQSLHVVMGCFGEFRDLDPADGFRYVGPGSPDDWSVSP